jgi:periplasmic protein TonB
VKRAQRLLLVAFALSLLIHLIVALILRPAAPTTENQAEVVSIEHRPATIAVAAVTPRPPRPKVTPAPRAPSSAPPRKGPQGVGSGAGAAARTPAPPAAVSTPAPTAAASAGCAQTNTAAAVVSTPAPPDIAPETRASATNGTAVVSVQLDQTGQVTGANVTQSTGNSSLDLVALAMARDARYAPALRDCKPIASAYAFSVKFVAW